MKKLILDAIEASGDLSAEAIILRLCAAVVIASFIFLSYRLSHDGSIYSNKFNVSLVVLTLITTTVMIVIGNHIALSLGMVGALSIVRFRTAVKDTRDKIYIFWCITVGICCGAGDYVVAACGSALIFLVLLLFGRVKNDNRMLIIIRTVRVNEEKVEALMFQYFSGKAQMRVKNTTETSIEFIYELSKKVMEKTKFKDKSITSAVYEIGNIEYCNIVMQNDEIGS
jgi:uncharacterized membrane protein YhiD involved in acid resistance